MHVAKSPITVLAEALAEREELKGRGPAAEQLRNAKVPAEPTDVFFDIANFVEKNREKERRQKAEVTLHVKGKDIFCECDDADLYAAIDALADKLAQLLAKENKSVAAVGVLHLIGKNSVPALLGAREVGFTVLAISLSLVACVSVPPESTTLRQRPKASAPRPRRTPTCRGSSGGAARRDQKICP